MRYARNLAIPAFIRVGVDTLSEFNGLVSEYNLIGDEAVLITTAHLRDKYEQGMSKLNIARVILVSSAQIAEAQKLGAELCELHPPPLLVAFGGGKVIE